MFEFLDNIDDMNIDDMNIEDNEYNSFDENMCINNDLSEFSLASEDIDIESADDYAFTDGNSQPDYGDSVSFGSRSSEYDMKEVESELVKASDYQDKADDHFDKAEQATKDGRYADAARETGWGNRELERANMHKEFAERARKR